MALSLERKSQDAQGHYQRWRLAAGDRLYLNFTQQPRNTGALAKFFVGQTIFNPGVEWWATPEGGRVTPETAFRPDYSKNDASHWAAHGAHPDIEERTGYREDAPLSALRFTAVGGPAIVEVRSLIELKAGA